MSAMSRTTIIRATTAALRDLAVSDKRCNFLLHIGQLVPTTSSSSGYY